MPNFSKSSLEKLNTCHPDLKYLFDAVICEVDCKVIEGFRSLERQNELYDLGHSKLRGGRSKHNTTKEVNGKIFPWATAVDVGIYFPGYGIRWQDAQSQIYFAGIVKGTAIMKGIPIRCGVDWNQNFNVSDNWLDAWHFELMT